MKMYSLAADIFITDVLPCYSKGYLTHYIVKNSHTGNIEEIDRDVMESFIELDKCEALN